VLDDAVWQGAAHSDAFRTVEPQENGTPTERTEFWLTYDADNIYVAIRSSDTGGLAGIRAYSMQRDQDNGSDDLVRIVFDTFHRENDGYYFALTAAGGKHDGLIQNKEQANDQWDAIWFGKATIDAGGAGGIMAAHGDVDGVGIVGDPELGALRHRAALGGLDHAEGIAVRGALPDGVVKHAIDLGRRRGRADVERRDAVARLVRGWRRPGQLARGGGRRQQPAGGHQMEEAAHRGEGQQEEIPGKGNPKFRCVQLVTEAKATGYQISAASHPAAPVRAARGAGAGRW